MPLIFKEDKDKQKEKYSKYGTTITEYTDTGSNPSYSLGSDYEYADPEMEDTYQAFVQAVEKANPNADLSFWDSLGRDSLQSQKDNVFNVLGNAFRSEDLDDWLSDSTPAPFTPTSAQNTSLFDILEKAATNQGKQDLVTNYGRNDDLTKEDRDAILFTMDSADTMEELESAYQEAVSYGSDELNQTATAIYYLKSIDMTGSAQALPAGYEGYAKTLDYRLAPAFEDYDTLMDELLASNGELSYTERSLEQIALGNYSDEVTLAGTLGQIGLGLADLDLPGDIRDLTYDLTNWEWDWGHAGQTLIDTIGLFPIVGAIKYSDEAAELAQAAMKYGDEAAEVVEDAAKYGDDVADAMGSTGKAAEDAAEGAGDNIKLNNLEDLFDNPGTFGDATPDEWYTYFQNNGFNPQPLGSKSSLKGIPFDQGGGVRINWGGDRYLQYHPSTMSHHGEAYWKISSGPTGTLRFDMIGNLLP